MTRGTSDAARGGRSRLRRPSDTGGWPLTTGLVVAILVVLLVDLATGPVFRIIQLSVIAAVIAAMYCTVRQTVIVTVAFFAATAAMYIYSWKEAGFLTSYAVLAGNVAIGAALLRLCALRRQRDHLLAQALSASETVQRFLIRPFPLHTDDATVDGFYAPPRGRPWWAVTSTRRCPPGTAHGYLSAMYAARDCRRSRRG
ncbi:hypothetical protein ACWD4N_02830 [Streptomyces sp. NPDC002586]